MAEKKDIIIKVKPLVVKPGGVPKERP